MNQPLKPKIINRNIIFASHYLTNLQSQSAKISMEERTHDTFDNDCLFDLDLLHQICSGLDDGMPDKLDLEIFAKSSDKPPSNNDQKDISLSSWELSHASLPACESNISDCLFWNALLDATSNHDSKDDVLIHENKERSSKALRFPELLWTILNEEQHLSLISWQNDGRTFVIYDQSQFAAIVMPLYFQTTEWRSFQKQLNIYGFRKVNERRRVYCHQYFVKDEPVLMTLMKREKVYPRHKRRSSSEVNISSHPAI